MMFHGRGASLAAMLAAATLLSCGDDTTSDDNAATVATAPETSSPSTTSAAVASVPTLTSEAQPTMAGTDPPPKPPPPSSIGPQASSPVSDSSSSIAPPSVAARVDTAIADLAGRLGTTAQSITIVDSRAVTWSDASHGCPRPGMSYTQALTEGWLLVLEANGVRFEYHGGSTGELEYCADPRPPVGGGSGYGRYVS